MAVQVAVLFAPTLLAGAVATIYTAPGAPGTLVIGQGRLRFTNTSGGARAVTAYAVPSGGPTGDSTCFLFAESVPPNQHLDVDMPVLGPGGALRAFCDSANDVTLFQLDGVIFS